MKSFVQSISDDYLNKNGKIRDWSNVHLDPSEAARLLSYTLDQMQFKEFTLTKEEFASLFLKLSNVSEEYGKIKVLSPELYKIINLGLANEEKAVFFGDGSISISDKTVLVNGDIKFDLKVDGKDDKADDVVEVGKNANALYAAQELQTHQESEWDESPTTGGFYTSTGTTISDAVASYYAFSTKDKEGMNAARNILISPFTFAIGATVAGVYALYDNGATLLGKENLVRKGINNFYGLFTTNETTKSILTGTTEIVGIVLLQVGVNKVDKVLTNYLTEQISTAAVPGVTVPGYQTGIPMTVSVSTNGKDFTTLSNSEVSELLPYNTQPTVYTFDSNYGSSAANSAASTQSVVSQKTGGRLGSAATRQQVREIAECLENDGWKITGGGGIEKEEYLAPKNGYGANYVDITAIKNGQILRINTVTVNSLGIPVTRELNAAISINAKVGALDGNIYLIPKGSGLGNTQKILDAIGGK
jgi:hypothetical protein